MRFFQFLQACTTCYLYLRKVCPPVGDEVEEASFETHETYCERQNHALGSYWQTSDSEVWNSCLQIEAFCANHPCGCEASESGQASTSRQGLRLGLKAALETCLVHQQGFQIQVIVPRMMKSGSKRKGCKSPAFHGARVFKSWSCIRAKPSFFQFKVEQTCFCATTLDCLRMNLAFAVETRRVQAFFPPQQEQLNNLLAVESVPGPGHVLVKCD